VSEPSYEHEPYASFTIHVEDAYSLKSIPGVTIIVRDSRGQVRARATTDSHGDAELHFPYTYDVLYYITASANGYTPATDTLEPRELGGLRLTGFSLTPYKGGSPSLMTFNVYVYDVSSGAPLQNAGVWVMDKADLIGDVRGVTDKDGRLVFREMIPYYQDNEYYISVFRVGYGPGRIKFTGQQLAGREELNVNFGLSPINYGFAIISYEVKPHYEVRGGERAVGQ